MQEYIMTLIQVFSSWFIDAFNCFMNRLDTADTKNKISKLEEEARRLSEIIDFNVQSHFMHIPPETMSIKQF